MFTQTKHYLCYTQVMGSTPILKHWHRFHFTLLTKFIGSIPISKTVFFFGLIPILKHWYGFDLNFQHVLRFDSHS